MHVSLETYNTYSYDYAYTTFQSLYRHLKDLYPLKETPSQFRAPVDIYSYDYTDITNRNIVTIIFLKTDGLYRTWITYYSHTYSSKDTKEDF